MTSADTSTSALDVPVVRRVAGRRMAVRRVVALGISIAFAAGAAGLTQGCLVGSDGIRPPVDRVYFPTAMVISKGRNALYVANSDFDLQYNGGTVQALDLSSDAGMRTKARAVAEALDNEQSQAEACAAIGAKPNDELFTHPGVCTAIDLKPFVRKFATIGAFASSAVLLDRSDGQPGARLFVAVRGDPSVTYFDVNDDRDPNAVSPCGETICLDCAGSGDLNRCAPSHLIGSDPFTNPRQVTLPTEPSGIDGVALPTTSGDALVVSQEVSGSASLVVNRWAGVGPTLEYVLPQLPDGPIAVTSIPPPRLAKVAQESIAYRPGFLISHRAASQLTVVRYEDDERSAPARPFLSQSANVPITVSATGNDQRGMAIDSTERDACEALCAATDLTCMQQCLDKPLGLYVVSRSPSSLLVGQIETKAQITEGHVSGIDETISIDETHPLPFGPSAVRVGKIIDRSGKLATRIFAVSFDARLIEGYDPITRDLEFVIRTGRGPFGMAFDVGDRADGGGLEAYLYVGHFTDSYIGVVDLDLRRPTFGTILLSAGPPVPPREEQ